MIKDKIKFLNNFFGRKLNKFITALTVAMMIVSFFSLSAYAVVYSPGETLNPACAPTDLNCTVDITTFSSGMTVGTTTPSSTTNRLYNTSSTLYWNGSVLATGGVATTTINGASGPTLTFSTGTSGTDFAISTSTNSLTFNLPTTSSTVRGLLTSADWTTFNNKLGAALASGNIFIGNVSNVATGVAMSGDATLSNVGALTFANSGVTAGSYGSVTAIPVVTVDAKGRITSATTTSASGIVITGDVSGTLAAASVDKIKGTGVSITSLINGNLLQFNGTNWVNVTPASLGSIALSLGTSGTDASVSGSPASLGGTLTLNLPTASSAARGLLSSADWTTFNNKENAITASTTATYFRGDKTFRTLDTSVVSENGNLYYTDARARTALSATSPLTYNSGTGAFGINQASSTASGYLSSTDWNTFNNKLGTALNSGLVWVGNGSNVATAVALSGDATISNTGVLTIAADAVALSTDTTGNYVAGNTAGTGISVSGTASEGWSPTVAIDQAASLSWTGAHTFATSSGVSLNPHGTAAGNTTEIRFKELAANGTNYVGFKSPDALAANILWTLPTADGSNGQMLVSNGSGALSWTSGLTNSLSSGNIFVGNVSNVATGVAMSGDATLSNAGVLTLGNSGVTAATYGSTTTIPVITVDTKGRITLASSTSTPFTVSGAIVNADVSASANIALSKLASGSSIVTSLAAPTGSNANGGSISSNVLTLSLADGTNPGLVSTGTQTIAGVKTFSATSTFNGNVGIGTTNPITKFNVSGAGQTTANLTDSGNTGASLFLNDNTQVAGSGGALLFGGSGTNAKWFAGIKGVLSDGSSNSAGDLAFSVRGLPTDTALTERMRITAGGNVGIGTSTVPSGVSLYLAGGLTGNLRLENKAAFQFNGTSTSGFVNGSSGFQFQYWSDGHAYLDNFNGDFVFRGNGWANLMKLTGAGVLRVNGLASCGGIQTNASGDMSCTSDASLKDIQGAFGSGLSSIMKINPQTFSWKKDSGLYDGGVLYHGFIAQDVKNALPEAVTTGAQGQLQVNHLAITAATVNAIKEQQLQIAGLMGADALDFVNASSTVFASEASVDAAANASADTGLINDIAGFFKAKISSGVKVARNLIAERVTAVQGYFKRIFANELCLTDSNGELVCVTGEQLKNIRRQAPIQQTTNNAQPTTDATTIENATVDATQTNTDAQAQDTTSSITAAATTTADTAVIDLTATTTDTIIQSQ